MENIDYSYLCSIIANLLGAPVRVFDGEKEVFYRAVVRLPKDPMTPYRRDILAIPAHIGYFITPDFHYYGIARCEETAVVIGPSMQIRSDEKALKDLAFRCDVAPDEMEEFLTGMKSILPMPLDSILQILCAVNYIMNGEKLGLKDLRIYDAEQAMLKDRAEETRAEKGFGEDLAIEPQEMHNTLATEQTILTFVRRGDTAALKEWIAGMPAVRSGVLADNALRQMKNTFIVTATLASRAAIRGGMDTEDALSLSDAYIQKCELLGSIERITNLQYRMIFDYTERVEQLRAGGKAPSRLVADVANYIRRHLSEPVSTEEMAKALFLSRSRLSTRFRAETGVTLTDFILQEKTEEAKRLLQYTDKPAVAISAYLGFSSQSHFSRVFKKYAGCLPHEYRKRHEKG